jgi:hypothetical protein
LPALDFAPQSPYTGCQTVANSQRYMPFALNLLEIIQKNIDKIIKSIYNLLVYKIYEVIGMKIKFIIFSLVASLFSCTLTKVDIVPDYNYKTIIDERPDKYDYNHTNKKSFDGLCKIEYGFNKNPYLTKAYNTDGILIARKGPPFTFFIDLDEINRDIEYIKFDSFELVIKSVTYVLLDLKNIRYQTYIYYNGERNESGYGTANFFWEMNNDKILRELKEEHGINISELRLKGIESRKEIINKSKYEYSEEEQKILLEEKKFIFRLRIERLPINVANDEDVTVNISLAFTKSNGSIERIQFDNIYFRECSELDYSSRSYFIELLPEEKNARL